jgi:hypothetical protein
MRPLYDKIKPARDKTLSHNDLKSIQNQSTLGSFQKGLDKKYFEALKKFAEVAYEAATNEKMLSFDTVERDVAAFIVQFNKGSCKDVFNS